MNSEKFIKAIHSKKKIRVAFYSKQDEKEFTRICAPMDYGPSKKAKNKVNKFHMWDYESDKGQHVLSLNHEQIMDIKILDESFEPSEFVKWKTNWIIPRNWGDFS